MHIRFTQIITEQVPWRWSSDSGVTAENVQQKLEQQESGWRNEDTVAQQLERSVYISQTGNPVPGHESTCTLSPKACM